MEEQILRAPLRVKTMKKLLIATLLLASAIVLLAAEIPEKTDLESMTEESLTSFGEAVMKKDFSDFNQDIATVWQKQITAEKQ